MKSTVYIGIDPGKQGGIACIADNDIYTTKMPEKRMDVFRTLKQLKKGVSCVACIERVHAWPKQSRKVVFEVGMRYGVLLHSLQVLKIPFTNITAKEWQKGLSIPMRKKSETDYQWKRTILITALNLFPDLPLWENKTLGRQLQVCDALLIAEYCRRIHI